MPEWRLLSQQALRKNDCPRFFDRRKGQKASQALE